MTKDFKTFRAMAPRFHILLILLALVLPVLAENTEMQKQKDGIDPRLSDLKQPYQKVDWGLCLDGGSIGIEIIDKDGRKEQFALPVHRTGSNADYPKLYVGTMWVSPMSPDTKAVPVTNPAATIKRLFELIHYPPQTNPPKR